MSGREALRDRVAVWLKPDSTMRYNDADDIARLFLGWLAEPAQVEAMVAAAAGRLSNGNPAQWERDLVTNDIHAAIAALAGDRT